MYLSGKIQVFINGTQLDSIVSVEVHNDGNHIGASCDIVLPLNSRIEYNNGPGRLILPTRYLFNTGDHVIIEAKYEGYESFGPYGGWVRVFDGFLYDFYESTPIKIHCLDYIYWFNMGIYGANYVVTKKLTKAGNIQKGSIKGGEGKSWSKADGGIEFADLLQDIVDWVNYTIDLWNDENGTFIPFVTLIRPDLSFHLVDISFVNMSPAAVLEYLKRELGFNISFIGNSLYANVASFTRNTVKLSTDKNVIESNIQSTNLTKHRTQQSTGSNSVFLRIKLKAYFEKEDGTKDSLEVGDPNGKAIEVYFYKVTKGNLIEYPKRSGQMVAENYLKQANEALNQAYQKRYSGGVELYFYPVISLFDKIQYNDIRYTERNGDYVVTAQEISISDKGYHQKLKLADLTNFNIYTQANQNG